MTGMVSCTAPGCHRGTTTAAAAYSGRSSGFGRVVVSLAGMAVVGNIARVSSLTALTKSVEAKKRANSGLEESRKLAWDGKNVTVRRAALRRERGTRSTKSRGRFEGVHDEEQPIARSKAQEKRWRSAHRRHRTRGSIPTTSGGALGRMPPEEVVNNPDWEVSTWERVNGGWFRVMEHETWEDPWSEYHELEYTLTDLDHEDYLDEGDEWDRDEADRDLEEEYQRVLDEEYRDDQRMWATIEAEEAGELPFDDDTE